MYVCKCVVYAILIQCFQGLCSRLLGDRGQGLGTKAKDSVIKAKATAVCPRGHRKDEAKS